MIFRRAFFLFVAFLLVRTAVAAPAADNTLHWLGLKQISADTNAAPFLKVWRLPQTTALVAQTLDKLSRWPGHGATNTASAAFRPLLDDLVNSEFYLEIDTPTNSQSALRNPQLNINSAFRTPNSALLLAVHLPADRAAFWQTKLAAASAAWAAAGTPHRIEVSRAGDWTLVAVGLDQKKSLTEFAARLAAADSQFLSLATRHSSPSRPWLEAGLNSTFLSLVTCQSSLSKGEVGTLSPFSHLHLTVTCDPSNLLTRATIDLARPFTGPLPAWEIPTNFIHGPLTSFAAVRGIANWLAASPCWQKLQLTPAPDQACWWSRDGIPFQTYLAAPMPGASNQLARLSQRLMQNANPWLATNAEGSFAWNPFIGGILWNGAEMLTPFLFSTEFNHRGYLLAGLYPLSADAFALPPVKFLAAVRRQPNLVFGEVEGTGSRVEDGFFITQVARIVFHKPQMPHAAAGTVWLKTAEQLLGETTTFVTLDGPQRLVLERHSTLGLNALELHLLADWLESPQFPRGLHTFLAPPDKTP